MKKNLIVAGLFLLLTGLSANAMRRTRPEFTPVKLDIVAVSNELPYPLVIYPETDATKEKKQCYENITAFPMDYYYTHANVLSARGSAAMIAGSTADASGNFTFNKDCKIEIVQPNQRAYFFWKSHSGFTYDFEKRFTIHSAIPDQIARGGRSVIQKTLVITWDTSKKTFTISDGRLEIAQIMENANFMLIVHNDGSLAFEPVREAELPPSYEEATRTSQTARAPSPEETRIPARPAPRHEEAGPSTWTNFFSRLFQGSAEQQQMAAADNEAKNLIAILDLGELSVDQKNNIYIQLNKLENKVSSQLREVIRQKLRGPF